MSYLSFVMHGKELWAYVFINSDFFGVSDEDRAHLMWNVVDLHKKRENARDLEGENYDGRVTRGKETYYVGLSGICFNAELDTPNGKRKPKILLMKQADPSLN
jgi:hypothetical protein